MVACPACAAPLQDRLPPEDAAGIQPEYRGPLKSLCPATTPGEADFLISILAEQNIRAVLLESRPRDHQSPLVTIGAGDIMVGEMDLEPAKKILAELET